MKKTSIIFFALVFVSMFLYTYIFVKDNGALSINTDEKLKEDINIVIDAGHGGFDGGAVASDKTAEKDINLEISLRLRDIFLDNGFNVIMTREIDESTDDSNNVKKSKKRDMYKRLEILNENTNNIFISIHQNKFSDEKCSGTQVFFGGKNENSELLAKSIKNSIKENLQPNNKRQEVKAKKDLFLLYKAEVPAVLIECGFISNKEELQKLKNTDYQIELSKSIFDGVKNFVKL